MSDPPDPAARTDGTIEVIHQAPGDAPPGDPNAAPAEDDLFSREARPRRVILCTLEGWEADDLVELLEAAGIGARAVDLEDTEDATQVVVHHARLADAEAMLVEYTGDPSLVDDVGFDDDLEGAGSAGPGAGQTPDGFVSVASAPPAEIDPQAERLAAAGIDVRVEVPDAAATDDPWRATSTLWVPESDAERARSLLGIEL